MPKAAVLAIHEMLLAEHGGLPGIRDDGGLDAALASPQNQLAYASADLFDLAAQYASALTRNHPFMDGNKRVALTVACVFLEMNGYRLASPEPHAVHAMIGLSTRALDGRALAEWLRTNSKITRRRSASSRAASAANKRSRRRR